MGLGGRTLPFSSQERVGSAAAQLGGAGGRVCGANKARALFACSSGVGVQAKHVVLSGGRRRRRRRTNSAGGQRAGRPGLGVPVGQVDGAGKGAVDDLVESAGARAVSCLCRVPQECGGGEADGGRGAAAVAGGAPSAGVLRSVSPPAVSAGGITSAATVDGYGCDDSVSEASDAGGCVAAAECETETAGLCEPGALLERGLRTDGRVASGDGGVRYDGGGVDAASHDGGGGGCGRGGVDAVGQLAPDDACVPVRCAQVEPLPPADCPLNGSPGGAHASGEVDPEWTRAHVCSHPARAPLISWLGPVRLGGQPGAVLPSGESLPRAPAVAGRQGRVTSLVGIRTGTREPGGGVRYAVPRVALYWSTKGPRTWGWALRIECCPYDRGDKLGGWSLSTSVHGVATKPHMLSLQSPRVR